MHIRLSEELELTGVKIDEGKLYINLGTVRGDMLIDREDIKKNPSKFITIASYIDNTIQDIEKEI